MVSTLYLQRKIEKHNVTEITFLLFLQLHLKGLTKNLFTISTLTETPSVHSQFQQVLFGTKTWEGPTRNDPI